MIESKLCCFSHVPSAKRVLWQVTRQCNRKCEYCFYRTWDTEKRDADRDLAEAVAEKLAAHGYNDILLTGGEPMLVDGFLDIVRVFHDAGFAIAISTNGDFLGKDSVDVLSRFNVRSVNLSLDAADRSANDMRRGPRAYENTVRAIQCSQEGPWRTLVTTVLASWKLSSIANVMELLWNLGVRNMGFTWAYPEVLELQTSIGTVESISPKDCKVSFNRVRFCDSLESWGRCPVVEDGHLSLDTNTSFLTCIIGEDLRSTNGRRLFDIPESQVPVAISNAREGYVFPTCIPQRRTIAKVRRD